MGLTIRGLNENDAEAYKSSRLHALKTEPSSFVSAYETTSQLPASFFTDRATFRPDNFLFGAFDEDATNLPLRAMAGGYVEPELKRNYVGNVVSVWVHEDNRRQGLARTLTAKVMEQLKILEHVTTLQIGVTATNVGALRLYEDLGFERWGLEPRALRVGADYYDEIHLSFKVR